MNQTAVEWLVNELKTSKHYQRVINEVNQSSTQIKDVIEQAKAMEKEQMDKALTDRYTMGDLTFEEYYNKIYKKD